MGNRANDGVFLLEHCYTARSLNEVVWKSAGVEHAFVLIESPLNGKLGEAANKARASAMATLHEAGSGAGKAASSARTTAAVTTVVVMVMVVMVARAGGAVVVAVVVMVGLDGALAVAGNAAAEAGDANRTGHLASAAAAVTADDHRRVRHLVCVGVVLKEGAWLGWNFPWGWSWAALWAIDERARRVGCLIRHYGAAFSKALEGQVGGRAHAHLND